VGKVTIGGLIDRLESSGFVKRVPDKDDRRARRIVITKQGRQVLDKMVAIGRKLNLDILEGISERDIKVAETVLSRMKANIRKKLIPLRGDGDDVE
jgi:MarR family transcriptional regulator, transcriptional regulator for hemolysin